MRFQRNGKKPTAEAKARHRPLSAMFLIKTSGVGTGTLTGLATRNSGDGR